MEEPNPYAPPQSDLEAQPPRETQLAMLNRQRLERMKAMDAPLGILPLLIALLLAGGLLLALYYYEDLQHAPWVTIILVLYFGYRNWAVRRRLEKLGQRHYLELESLKKRGGGSGMSG